MKYLSNHFLRKILMILAIIYMLLNIANKIDLKSLLFVDAHALINSNFNSTEYPIVPLQYNSRSYNSSVHLISKTYSTDIGNYEYYFYQPSRGTSYIGFDNLFMQGHYYEVGYFYCYLDVNSDSVLYDSTIYLNDGHSYDSLYSFVDTAYPFRTNGTPLSNYQCAFGKDYFSLGIIDYHPLNGSYISTYQTVSANDIFSGFYVNDLGIGSIGMTRLIENVISNTNQEIIDNANENQQQTNDRLDNINDSLTNSDSSGASDSAGGFFDSFDSNDFGLSDVITMPLSFINDITSSTCSPLVVPLPFVNTNATLPCMNEVYSTYFGSFLSIYQIITTGFIAYWVCIKIFALVKGFKDPDTDKVEVMEL